MRGQCSSLVAPTACGTWAFGMGRWWIAPRPPAVPRLAPGRSRKHLGRPLVQALPRGFCRAQSGGVHLGWHPQHHLPGGLLEWTAAKLPAGLQVIVHRLLEGAPQPVHRVSVETHNILHPDQPANKKAILGGKLHASCETFMGHGVVHGSTPAAIRKSRASRN